MSAFLMLAAAAPKKPLPPSPSYARSRSSKSKLRPSNSLTSFSGYSSRASTRSTIGASLNGLLTETTRKKVFDPVKLTYVDFDSTVSLFERKLMHYNEAVVLAQQNSLGEGVNRILNDAIRAEAGGPVLTPENLEHLRYNYFEKFEPGSIMLKISQNTPQYAHVIAADEQIEALLSTDRHKLAADAVRAKVASMERKLACPTLNTADYSVSVRDAFHLSLFWDDVYHDIKCDSLGENYYGWLPPRQTTQRFYIELTDFALYRLRVVTCTVLETETRVLNADERHELTRNNFYYFQKSDAALAECLVLYLKENFLPHIKTYVVCPDLSHVRDLLSQVTAYVCENLKLHFYGHLRAELTTALLHDFMGSVIDALLLGFAPLASGQKLGALSPVSLATSVFERVASANSECYVLREAPRTTSILEKVVPQKLKRGLFGRFKK